jgi:transposase
MIENQQTMILSNYAELYNLIIPKDNMLRKIKELVDFNFIFDELKDKYCLDNGRNAINPIRMFKYLLLKVIFEISDVDVVERSKYDMSFKFFLDMAPEDDVIEPSSLTKFRKLRLRDSNLLDLLIGKTVGIAIDKGIIKSNSIIVDSTHTSARYNQKTPREVLLEYSKNLRKSVYKIDENLKNIMPPKVNNGVLEDEIEYCQKLIVAIRKDEVLSNYPSVKEKINLLEEAIEDDLEKLALSKDEDAKIGHKTYDTSFFGFKTHIAMTEERVITAATVTSGEKHDGKQLSSLVENSRKAGIKVENVIGDAAYSEKENLEYAKEENISLISKLSRTVTHGNARSATAGFEYNKDAGMYVCKAGHISIKKVNKRPKKNKKDGQGDVETYFFDIKKCKHCEHRQGCYKDGANSKSYSVSIKTNVHQEHMQFEKSEFFKEKAKERYKIEAKNSELKHRHGYDVASSSGLIGMELQGAMTIFAVNLKRIITLMK